MALRMRRHWLSFLVVVLSFETVPAASAQTMTLFDASASHEAPGASAVLRVDAAQRSALKDQPGPVTISMPLSVNEQVEVRLERFNVIAHDASFQVMDARGESQAIAAPDVVLLRGTIVDEPGSSVFLALDARGGGLGRVARASGAQFSLGSVMIDEARGERGIAVRPGVGELPDFTKFCSMIDPNGGRVHPGGTHGAQHGDLDARGLRLLRIAVDADQEYSDLFPNQLEAAEYVVMVIGAVSDIYMRDLGFRMELGFTRLWPFGGEPFSADSLSGFRTYWQNNEDMTDLNLIHMFSGRRNLSYGGVAYLASACSDSAFGISGYLMGSFPEVSEHGHLGNWDIVVIAHEMGHNMGTGHTHGYDPPIDFCTSGDVTYGSIMSYCHTLMGGLKNTDLRFHRRVQQFIAGNNPDGECLVFDCNANGIDDAADIADGVSADTNGNGIPDECEDCNGNGVLDPDDIAGGGATDVNGNGIPDSCEDDCNGNGVPDLHEITLGEASDLNGNNIPDSCEPDCDGSGIADFIEIESGFAQDVNRNRRPDICDDCNGNGIVDWLDTERAQHLYMASAFGFGDNTSVREYHPESGVLISVLGTGSIQDGVDLEFGEDRQLYVASYSNGRIIRIDVDTDDATTFVDFGDGGLLAPGGVTFGPDGHLYVADNQGDAIRKYDGVTGASLGDFVAPGVGDLDGPWNLKFGPDGHLYVTSSPDVIRRYDGTTGASMGVFAFNGLDEPRGLAFLDDDLLVANQGSSSIMRFDPSGTTLGQFNGSYPIGGQWMIEVGVRGNVFVARQSSPVRIVEFDRDRGIYLRSFVRGDNDLLNPVAIAFRPGSANDVNGDFIPDDCQCSADIDGSGAVGVDDLLALLSSWGPCVECAADLTGDATVDVNDLLVMLAAWGDC